MARYVGATCKLCRREGLKLFLKGIRCHTAKCAFEHRSYSPGEHGANSMRAKVSNYGLQLREKQKVKRTYGILEKQFRNYFTKAAKSKAVTGTVLLQLLEQRLDNVVYRLGFAPSRAAARQMVLHGFVLVNDRRVNIPSYQVKEGDELKIKANEKQQATIRDQAQDISKRRQVPGWMAADYKELMGKVSAIPGRDDIQDIPIQEQLIVELYSK